MNINGKNVLLTGASGGIGRELTKLLAEKDCNLVISGRDYKSLSRVKDEISDKASKVTMIQADINLSEDCQRLVNKSKQILGEIDILINLAGVQYFSELSNLSDEAINLQVQTNLIAPIRLSKNIIRVFQQQGFGHIVNIGSTFGSIGFANFSVYCATKFGLRGFTEAIRRELKTKNIKATYIAPRAVKTDMNSQAVFDMAKATKMKMDEPKYVANQIIRAIEKRSNYYYIGMQEKIFSLINALFPSLIDKGLAKQNKIAQNFANATNSANN